MQFVTAKSVEQQARLAVHTTPALPVRQRTQAANALRAALNEIGMVAAQGVKGLRQLMQQLERPPELRNLCRHLAAGYGRYLTVPAQTTRRVNARIVLARRKSILFY